MNQLLVCPQSGLKRGDNKKSRICTRVLKEFESNQVYKAEKNCVVSGVTAKSYIWHHTCKNVLYRSIFEIQNANTPESRADSEE